MGIDPPGEVCGESSIKSLVVGDVDACGQAFSDVISEANTYA